MQKRNKKKRANKMKRVAVIGNNTASKLFGKMLAVAAGMGTIFNKVADSVQSSSLKGSRNWRSPHQGEKECARRRCQLQKGRIFDHVNGWEFYRQESDRSPACQQG